MRRQGKSTPPISEGRLVLPGVQPGNETSNAKHQKRCQL